MKVQASEAKVVTRRSNKEIASNKDEEVKAEHKIEEINSTREDESSPAEPASTEALAKRPGADDKQAIPSAASPPPTTAVSTTPLSQPTQLPVLVSLPAPPPPPPPPAPYTTVRPPLLPLVRPPPPIQTAGIMRPPLPFPSNSHQIPNIAALPRPPMPGAGPMQPIPLRGANPAQIAEMIAAARQIQQQRLLLQQNNQQPSTGDGGARPVPDNDPSSSGGASLKRKAEEQTPTGIAMGYPPLEGNTVAVAREDEGIGVVDTSADNQGPAAVGGDTALVGGMQPATSLSAHYTFGGANSNEMYGDDDGSGESAPGGDGKKVRLVWTQELHNRFINALSHLGLKHAVPKNILTLMNVEGMTRENVASHLQKYRLYLKKMGGYTDKERVETDALQSLHEQNVQHMAAQQAMQQSMHTAIHHQGTTAGGLGISIPPPSVSAGLYIHHHSSLPLPVPTTTGATVAPVHFIQDIVEGIPVSDIPVDEPVSPTVMAAVAAGGRFNPRGWQYPSMPISIPPQPHDMYAPSPSLHHHSNHGGTTMATTINRPLDGNARVTLQSTTVMGLPPGPNYPVHAGIVGGVVVAAGTTRGTALDTDDDHQPPTALDDDVGGEGWADRWAAGGPHELGHEGAVDGGQSGPEAQGNASRMLGGGGDTVHPRDDEDDEDPPLIRAAPSAGDLHQAVERLPLRMTDAA